MKITVSAVVKALKLLLYAVGCFAVVRWDLRRWAVAAALFLITDMALAAVHEAGHWIGGLLSGCRFCLWSNGPILILKRKGRVSLRFNEDFVSQCVMIPKGDRYAPYQLGGIAVSAAVFCVCAVFGVIGRSPVLLCAAYVSVFKILSNILPGMTPPNDFTVFRMLKSSPAERENYRIYLREFERNLNEGLRANAGLAEPRYKTGYFYDRIIEQRNLYGGTSPG